MQIVLNLIGLVKGRVIYLLVLILRGMLGVEKFASIYSYLFGNLAADMGQAVWIIFTTYENFKPLFTVSNGPIGLCRPSDHEIILIGFATWTCMVEEGNRMSKSNIARTTTWTNSDKVLLIDKGKPITNVIQVLRTFDNRVEEIILFEKGFTRSFSPKVWNLALVTSFPSWVATILLWQARHLFWWILVNWSWTKNQSKFIDRPSPLPPWIFSYQSIFAILGYNQYLSEPDSQITARCLHFWRSTRYLVSWCILQN